MPFSAALSDAELHGLVDGQLDPERRAEILRRAARSPRDRAIVECWQDQADTIRSAFSGVLHEQLPASLDLRVPTLLHLAPPAAAPVLPAPTRRRTNWIGAVATLAVMAAGLAGSWLIASLPAEGPGGAGTTRPFGDDEKAVADRTLAALAFAENETPPMSGPVEAPALAAIPDLSAAGFVFTGAEARGISPKAVVFRYRSAAGERVAVGAARTRSSGAANGVAPRDGGLTWHKGLVSYAIFGTVGSDRLRTLAAMAGAADEAEPKHPR